MPELSKKIITDLRKDKKIDIKKIIRGKKAVQKVKTLFFGDDKKKASKWASQWNTSQKSRSVLIVYTRKKKVNKVAGFKFVIGDEDTGSVLGEEMN